jgi:phospholipid-binding lipoprotein MlaA
MNTDSRMKATSISLLCLMFSVVLSGCAVSNQSHPRDPLEPLNRKIFALNDTVDTYVMRPVAKGYDTVFPGPVKKGISNVYSNIWLVPTIANDILQLKPFKAGEASLRLLINTTVGLGGIWDPATHMGVKNHVQDMGLTLAAWGWEDSSYLVLPLIGPSTIRDTGGMAVDEYVFYPPIHLHEKSARDKVYMVRFLDTRYRLLEADKFLDDAIDKYQMQRDAYLQFRDSKIDANKGVTADDTYVE